jgi:hypothetical protein
MPVYRLVTLVCDYCSALLKAYRFRRSEFVRNDGSRPGGTIEPWQVHYDGEVTCGSAICREKRKARWGN